jgi:hypothetical protein
MWAVNVNTSTQTMELITCSETSSNKCNTLLGNISKTRINHSVYGESLNARFIVLVASGNKEYLDLRDSG